MLAVSLLGFYFREKMEGTAQRTGERFDRSFRFDLDVHAPSVLRMATTAVAEAHGTLRIDGLARDVPATGRLELSPVARQTIRYVVDFTGDDGKSYRFDGSKSTTVRRHLVGWTTLPGKIYDESGQVWGDAELHFSLRRQLRKLIRSVRLGPRAASAGHHADPLRA
jgi:hypothetical protein